MDGATRRPLLRWLGLFAALALGLAACGGDGADGTDAEDVAAQTQDPGTTGEAEPAQASPTAAAQPSGESCYAGETVTFVVSFGAGGGYDAIARAMAPYLEDELGATVVVENQTGAGGLLALNNLAAADPEEPTFGFFTGPGVIGSVLGGAEGVNFDVMDLSFVGRQGSDPRVLVVPASSDLQDIEDVMAAEDLQFGSAGPGASDYIDATVLLPVLDLDAEIVTGFEGSAETELALTSGDIDLASGTIGSRRTAIESGDHRPVLAIGAEPLEGFPDVPPLTELDLSDENLANAQALSDLHEMGRMFFAPPGVPEDCLSELTTAVGNVLAHPEVDAQVEAMDRETVWIPGPEMREVAQNLLDSPDSFTALLEQAYAPQ